MAVIAVLPEWHFAKEEIAQLIDAVGIRQGERINDIADRLRHFLTAVKQKAVREDATRHFNTRRHQKSRPVNGVKTYNVLADHMQIGRPIFLELFAFGIWKAYGGDVIGQRVDPDIHDVLGIAGDLYSPVKRGARERKILQPAAHEACDFVEPLFRQHKVRDTLVEV